MKRQARPTEFGDEQLRALGRRLRELREARSWSLRRMASESGVSVAAIQTIESGGTSPSLQTVVALAGALGEPVDRLVASSKAATFAAQVGRGRLGDISSELQGPAVRPSLGARLLVVPARRSVEDVGSEGAGFFYVLDGKVRLAFTDGNTEDLASGDAVHLAGGLAARCTNLLPRRSRILFFTDRREPADRFLEFA
jgi:transcriptional regulator with XRE-family HTH domain